MNIFCKIVALALVVGLFLSVAPGRAGDTAYLDRMARESEIKSIAVVTNVQHMGANSDGTFLRVTFRNEYAVTPFTPDSFVGGCKAMENNWQTRSPGMVYFSPKRGQKVFVTISANGGAITSFTPLTPQLDAAVRNDPWRIVYRQGHATVPFSDD
jgi:hypothetical protein